MPNYVRNLIKVVDGDFQAVADFMKSETNDFDFNKLIPMPPTMLYLKKYNGISRQSELGFMYWSAPTKVDKYALNSAIKAKGYDLRSTLKEGLDRYLAYKDCGHWNSLDWAVANWGTKWNAFDVDVNPSDHTIFFNTAWTAPIPIYKALAKQFPTHKITVKYYDEGGWFAGYCNIKDGNVFSEDYECESDKGKEIINEINKYIMTNREEEQHTKDDGIDWKAVYDAEVVRHAKVEEAIKAELDALKAEHAKVQQQLTEYRQALAELSKSNSEMVKEIATLSLSACGYRCGKIGDTYKCGHQDNFGNPCDIDNCNRNDK